MELIRTILNQILYFFACRIRYLIIIGIIGTIMAVFGLSVWLERVFVPVQGRLVHTFGARYAFTIARETDDYFRMHGAKSDCLWENVAAVAAKAHEIEVYRITINEAIGDARYGVLYPSLFRVEQKIIFERAANVIKVQVARGTVQQANKSAYYDGLFADYRLLPFGTYFIIADGGERYILTNIGGEKSAVKAADHQALYSRLMSYAITNIIDYKALQNQALSCFAVTRVQEYSSPESYSDEMSAIYLREYQSIPAVYQMRYESEGVRHQIKAEFYYWKVNDKTPKIREYLINRG